MENITDISAAGRSMSETTPESATQPQPQPKPKRKMSEQQLANLAKGRAAREAKRAEKKSQGAESPAQSRTTKAPAASLDDVAQRHAHEPRFEPEEPDDDTPSIEEIAKRTRLYTMSDSVPMPETNNELADGITMEVPDFAGDQQKPHTLEDLFAIAPIGDGQYYVSVDRRTPKTWGSVQCAGTQRSITRYMTREDFAAEYGGGVYTLILYGPPKRGQMIDPNTGRGRVKALTAPITVTVPIGTYPPNLQAAILDDEHYEDEDTAMRYGPGFNAPARPGNGRPSTVADARMFEAQLSFEERMQQRNEERERELRQEAGSVAGSLTPMVEMLRRQAETSQERLEREFNQRAGVMKEQIDRERIERQRAEQRVAEREALEARRPAEDLKGVASIITAMKDRGPQGEDIARLTDAAAKDRERLMQQHQVEAARITETYERRAKDAEERADRRVKESEERAEARIKEGNERADRRVQEAKEDAKRQIEDVRTHMSARLQDEQRNHDRDLAAKNDSWQARLETQKAMYENRISTLGEEITRLRAEAERFRKEAEENKDLPTQLQKFTSVAEVMGFRKDGGGGDDDEPKDWKSMLGRIGLDLVQQLPQLMESASSTVQRLRAPQSQDQMAAAQAAQYQQMMLDANMPRALAPSNGVGMFQPSQLAFGTEDGPEYQGVEEHREPIYPVAAQAAPPAPMQPASQPQQQRMQPAPRRSMQSVAQPPPPPAAPAPAPQRAGPPPAASGGMVISDEQILQFTPVLQGALEQGASPEEFAVQFVESVGPVMARQIAATITPERISAAVQRQPGGSQNPLVRREGQKFLRELWDAVKRAAA